MRLSGRVADDVHIGCNRLEGRRDGLVGGAREGLLELVFLLLLLREGTLLASHESRGTDGCVAREMGLESSAWPHAPSAVHEAAAVGVHVVGPAQLFVDLGRGGDGGRLGGRGRGRGGGGDSWIYGDNIAFGEDKLVTARAPGGIHECVR